MENHREVGNRVIVDFKRPDKELIEEFRGIPSSNIGDMMSRLYCMNGEIRAMNSMPLLGTAFTVKVPAGDNAMLHYAMDMAQPGDVIAVDGGGFEHRALCGEIMFTYSMVRKIAGFVVNGAVRDSAAAKEMNFPVYAKAVCPQGPYKNGLGEINVPVVCAGQVVMPGDILVGDGDGIVVIRQEDAPAILKKAQQKLAGEEQLLARYHKGELDSVEHIELYTSILKANKTEIQSKGEAC